MEEKDINRLLMQYQQLFRKSNKKYINPEIEELTVEGLEPIIIMVAKSRAAYMKYVYALGKKYGENEGLPTTDELKKLKILKMRFTEVSEGAHAFETCIQRGYLDLKHS